MKVLILNNFNSSGSMLQDMVMWKSGDGHISTDNQPFGVNTTYLVLLVDTHAQKQPSIDNFQALQWLRGNGCGWSGYTCEAAAENGHLSILLVMAIYLFAYW